MTLNFTFANSESECHNNPLQIYERIMNRSKLILIFFLLVRFTDCFAQFPNDGSYFWHVTNVNYSINDKISLLLNMKEQFSNQINRVDFFHAELTAFRKINATFSVGLGYRQTENYRSAIWCAGHNYLLYGVCQFSPLNMKIRFSNRIVYKSFKQEDSQVGLDNITNIDFFVRSTNCIPKPFVSDEVFSELRSMVLQNVRLYGGLHIWKGEFLGIDLFYCDIFVNSVNIWSNFSVYGLNTKFNI